MLVIDNCQTIKHFNIFYNFGGIPNATNEFVIVRVGDCNRIEVEYIGYSKTHNRIIGAPIRQNQQNK